jgi:hypothetical protein
MLHQGFDSLFFKKTDIPIYFPKYEAENNFIFPDSYKNLLIYIIWVKTP